MAHEHVWEETEFDSPKTKRFRCSDCGAFGWCSWVSWVTRAKKAPVIRIYAWHHWVYAKYNHRLEEAHRTSRIERMPRNLVP